MRGMKRREGAYEEFGVVVLEDTGSLGGGLLRVGVSAREGYALVVVYLDHLVDRFEVQSEDALFHQFDPPSRVQRIEYLNIMNGRVNSPKEALDITKDSLEILVRAVQIVTKSSVSQSRRNCQ